jgi:formylglycine-generating enzyme required for sulfatase activity
MRHRRSRATAAFVDGLTLVAGLCGGACGAHQGASDVASSPEGRGPSIPGGISFAPLAPRVWLFSVGISNYRDASLNLTSAENDARAIDEFFEPMIDSARRRFLDSAHATRRDIVGELHDLKRRTGRGDALIVYLSMHAAKGERGRFYLLPNEAEKGNPEVDGIAGEELQNLVRPVEGEASHVIVILDTCLSGSVTSSDRDVRASVDAAAAGKFLLAGGAGGVGVLSSSGPGEDSLEDVSARHGLLTEYLIRGLTGEADRAPWGNQDGRLTFREVFEYVKDGVKRQSGDKQHPLFTGDDGIWLNVGGATATAAVPPPPASEGCPPGMVRQPAGQFTMGEHRPIRSLTCDYVTLDSFCIDATEVTVAAYGRCPQCSSTSTVAYYGVRMPEAAKKAEDARCNANHLDRGQQPVNCVDWAQAQTFCRAQGKRLPTEEEWEWAARRGASGTPYPWGTAPPGEQLCWSGIGKRDGTCSVGGRSLGDTAGGVHDLAGNIAEWTSTPFDRGTRVSKGGAWRSAAAGEVTAMGPGSRGNTPESLRSLGIGFRCVWPMNSEPPRVKNDMCR